MLQGRLDAYLEPESNDTPCMRHLMQYAAGPTIYLSLPDLYNCSSFSVTPF